MTRKTRQPVTDECLAYARKYGARKAADKYGNEKSSINGALRRRGWGRGTPRGTVQQEADPESFAWIAERILERCGYVSACQVRRDAERFSV